MESRVIFLKHLHRNLLFSALFAAVWLSLIAMATPGALPGVLQILRDSLSAPGLFLSLSPTHPPDEVYDALESEMLHASGIRNDSKELFAALQTAQQKNETRNYLYIKDRDGFLHKGNFYQSPDGLIANYAKSLRRLQEQLPDETRLLFVGALPRYVEGETSVYSGYPVDRQSARNMDALQLALFSNGIDTLDLRYTRMSRMSREELFYRTDSKWTTQAAFTAFQILVGELETRYDLRLDPDGTIRDPSGYTRSIFPGLMLGDMGKSTGAIFSGTDDFSLIEPNFETAFDVESYSRPGRVSSGSFQEVLLFESALNAPTLQELKPFSAYLGSSQIAMRIDNRLNRDGPRILLIGDTSFAPVCAFLAPAASRVTMVTPGASGAPPLSQLLEETWDVVIVAVPPSGASADFFQYTDSVSKQ